MDPMTIMMLATAAFSLGSAIWDASTPSAAEKLNEKTLKELRKNVGLSREQYDQVHKLFRSVMDRVQESKGEYEKVAAATGQRSGKDLADIKENETMARAQATNDVGNMLLTWNAQVEGAQRGEIARRQEYAASARDARSQRLMQGISGTAQNLGMYASMGGFEGGTGLSRGISRASEINQIQDPAMRAASYQQWKQGNPNQANRFMFNDDGSLTMAQAQSPALQEAPNQGLLRQGAAGDKATSGSTYNPPGAFDIMARQTPGVPGRVSELEDQGVGSRHLSGVTNPIFTAPSREDWEKEHPFHWIGDADYDEEYGFENRGIHTGRGG